MKISSTVYFHFREFSQISLNFFRQKRVENIAIIACNMHYKGQIFTAIFQTTVLAIKNGPNNVRWKRHFYQIITDTTYTEQFWKVQNLTVSIFSLVWDSSSTVLFWHFYSSRWENPLASIQLVLNITLWNCIDIFRAVKFLKGQFVSKAFRGFKGSVEEKPLFLSLEILATSFIHATTTNSFLREICFQKRGLAFMAVLQKYYRPSCREGVKWSKIHHIVFMALMYSLGHQQ